LANEIHKFFDHLECDLDVSKVNFNNKRPDIIFHKRNSHESNLLVIEVKRNGNKKEIEEDIEKIKSCWFQPPLSYRFGAAINLKDDKTYDLLVFQNE